MEWYREAKKTLCRRAIKGFIFSLLALACPVLASEDAVAEFTEKTAIEVSQGVLGRTVGNHELIRSDGSRFKLNEYRGKPLVFSLVYTSCYHICPTTTRHLASVVEKARKVLGEDSFRVITLGFDHLNDTPDTMRQFAATQGIDDPYWDFASATEETVLALSEQLGFIFFPSPNGFDHLIQATVVDGKGMVFTQVYDIRFDTPLLVEPLKKLVFSSEDSAPLISRVTNRIRLFCTVYDPINDQYRIDYSIFIGMLIGLTTMGAVLYMVIRQWRSQNGSVS
ncbi:MAG: SCO family protein [Gammaproteobacteria bacterium]|nr:SCO family protein [Gammaproteobacteria bacterium]